VTRSASSARRRGSRSQAKAPPLSELDLRILALLHRHRVLTQNQLAAISPGTPERTLRYRCARLARCGLAGRSRPYRERGSAPHHLWPTRKGEALVSGSPLPRGGERREPNTLFLAHAAGLSEVYVALETTRPAGTKLARFEREGEAREPFSTWPGREQRAIAPDAFIEIADADGRSLLAFLELDMGTMSHRRLRQKAAGYAEYAKAEAWRERHRFCPALLFLTTTERRARSFLAAMRKELGQDSMLLSCACELARRPERIAAGSRWLLSVDGGEEPVELLGALDEARRPHDEALARAQAERRREEAERERLRSDPEALRAHLHNWRGRWEIERLGEPRARAVEIALERGGELHEAERRALLALGGLFADPLRPRLAEREPSAEERRALDGLAEHCGAEQLRRVEALVGRFGEGPALRAARRRIEAGELLSAPEIWSLDLAGGEDRTSRAEQERLASAYLAWRQREARRLFKAQGFLARLRSGPEDFLAEIDERSLRRCRRCEEIAYPDPKRAREERKRGDVAFRCHFCGETAALAPYRPSGDPGGCDPQPPAVADRAGS
jgi:Replication-relaxation